MALHRAARLGHVEMVILLLGFGADINAKGENDWYNRIFFKKNLFTVN